MSKNWHEPQPASAPLEYPRRVPKRIVPSYIGDEGIVANWLFYYEKGGDHLHDFGPRDNHGTIYGAKWTDEYSASWVLTFDGDDDYADVTAPSPLDLAQFSILAWVKTTVTTLDHQIIAQWDDANRLQFKANESASGDLDFSITDGGGDSDRANAGDTGVNDGSWHLVAGVFDNGDFYLYLDGSLIDSTLDTAVDGLALYSNTTLIGNVPGYAQYWDGEIGVIRIYNRALPESEIEDHYGATRVLYGV